MIYHRDHCMPRPAFQPAYNTVNLAVGVASASVSLPAGYRFRLSNAGRTAISIRFGDATVTAAPTDAEILPGTAELITPPAGATHLAAVVASCTATLKITPEYVHLH